MNKAGKNDRIRARKDGEHAMKLLIVIPAFNEAENIARVVKELQKTVPEYDFVIVNDGSRDRTGAICRENGYPTLNLSTNLGLTVAFQTGMRYAWEKGYDAVIQIDGDGQHDPQYISAMAEKMEADGADLVIASRFMNGKRTRTLRTFGNTILCKAVRLTTGRKITDSTSGMRMYGRRVLEIMANDLNSTPEPDTVTYLLLCGAKVEEYPVTMRERTGGESYLSPAKSIAYMVHMCLSICLIQRLRKRRAL